ncbi:MAG: BTAD domain-containing putative transcriptional regulator [Gemmatimonadaceae bacterium]|nr:BTAD domain-containing putative transcriptional regulator [Gemmatimonadaceae bacterium]
MSVSSPSAHREVTPVLFLRVLGGLALERDGVPLDTMAAQRKSLALLALLAVAGPRGMSRDALIAYVWPESDTERARGALRQALHAMRPRVGDAELLVGGSELRLNPEIVSSDVARFTDCLACGALAEAVSAYGGPFLDGYHLGGAPAFEQWVAEQRSRLAREFGGALERLANEAASRGAFADAVASWYRLAATEPLNGRVAVGLIRALAAAGDPAAALRHAAIHETLLREELECAPDPAVVALAAKLRSQSEAPRKEPSSAPPSSLNGDVGAGEAGAQGKLEVEGSGTMVAPPRLSRRRASRAMLIARGLLVIVAASGVWWAFGRPERPVAPTTPRLLIAPFENLTGDARLDHVGRMAADRLAFGVAQVGSMDVVPSIAVLMTMRDTTGGAADRLKRLSDATSAGLLVSGTVVLRGDSLVLQAQVTDVRTGKTVATLDPATGSAADPIAIIDELGDRLLGALGNRDRGLAILPQGTRAPKYAAYQELAAGFERFVVHGDFVGSRLFFERAIVIDSTYTRAYQLLGRQYLNAGEYARADSMARRIERLPQGLSATERLQLEYMKAELNGDIAGRLRTQQQLVARDSSALALESVGEAATWLLRPDLALPALQRSGPAYLVIGGGAARHHVSLLAEAYHETGAHDRELRALLDNQAVFSDVGQVRGRELRAYAGLGRGAEALALAETMLSGSRDSSGIVAIHLVTGAEEFRSHGDARTASRLLAMASAWIVAHPAPAASRDRQFREGVVMLASGMSDSAIVRFAVVARDTARVDAAGYLALAQLARGDRASAQAAADSLGALNRPWLFGAQTFWRAAILGALGERDLAVQLLQQANREGRQMQLWHFMSALDSLRGYAAFEALIRPKR